MKPLSQLSQGPLRTLVLSLLLMVAALLTTAQAQEVTLRYAHPNGPETIPGRFATTFADLVSEKTEGRVQVNVFPASQLGGVREMIEGTSLGTISMGHNDYAAVAQLMEDLAVFNVPYLYRDIEHAMTAGTPEDSEVVRELNDRLVQEANVRLIGNFYYGYRHLTANAAIYTPDDLRGREIRAIPLPVWIAAIEGMGAIPTPVDFAELPTALATGIVDGQENPLTTIHGHGFYEMQDYLMLTGHMIAALAVYINEREWARISPEDQEAVIEAVQEASALTVEWGLEEEDELLEQLEAAGMTIIGPDEGLDLEAFQARVRDHVLNEFPEWADYIERIEAVE